MSFVLRLTQVPAVRVDVRGIVPAALAGLAAAEVERLPVIQGRRVLPLGEFFQVSARSDDLLVFEGDLSRCDRIGWQMAAGRVRVEGPAGDYVGGCMTGGELTVRGPAGLLAACEMAGGLLRIDGDAGGWAASALPGSMDGMRGGTLIVKGNAGERFGDRMRRGSALVCGDVGDFAASRMVAGTIAIGGRAGAHVGYGMRRGSVVFAGAAPLVGPTFVPAVADVPVFWQLLARDLARHGGPFEALPGRRIGRHLGDLAADGKGELIIAQ
jgi:formylmethanofuran dehydrogenase subunit C